MKRYKKIIVWIIIIGIPTLVFYLDLFGLKSKDTVQKVPSGEGVKIGDAKSGRDINISINQNLEEKAEVTKEKIKVVKIRKPNLYISQEYPSSQDYNYQQSINLSKDNIAVMTLSEEEQAMWFGLGNLDMANAGNPRLFLHFDGSFDVNVREASTGWIEMDPDREYNISIRGAIQPGGGFKLNPLFVKFPAVGSYSAKYSITSDDNLPVSGIFVINVANN